MEPIDQYSNTENEIFKLLDELYHNPLRGWPDIIAQLKKVDRDSLVKTARILLEDSNPEKRRQGIEALMATDPEKNVSLILPMLSDVDPEVRYLAMYYIKRPKELLKDKRIISLVIKSLFEDPSPVVRIEAAEALGECTTSEEAKSALLWARDHDFEYDDQGYNVSYIAKIALENFSSE
ncbi:MAG TPA: HEAT repeat domain-containing protein [Anaerolineales bacterium]|nr:HEAT repeat domain-containing protein [Anaerolineales bacterium]